MNFGQPTDEKDSIRIIHEAIDAGINFIDTANVYNKGVSEEIVGQALKDCRDRVVLATKVHGRMGDGPNDRGNSRYHITQQVEASLRRLQTDHIDLYQLHRPDPNTPIEEQLGVLSDLVRQGKVLYIGTSTFPAWELCEAQWVSERRNLEKFVCEQPPYSILARKAEKDTLRFCARYGVAVIPWSPLAGGWLTGKYRKGKSLPENSRGDRRDWDLESQEGQRRLDAVEALVELANERGVPLTQCALAWTLANPVVTAPIIGPRTTDQLKDNLGALGLHLDAEILKKVDEIVPPCADLMGVGP